MTKEWDRAFLKMLSLKAIRNLRDEVSREKSPALDQLHKELEKELVDVVERRFGKDFHLVRSA